MQINIKGTGIDLTDSLKEYVDEKIGGLDRFLSSMHAPVNAIVEVGRSTEHHRKGNMLFAEVNLHVGGKLLRAKFYADDVRAAVDEVREELYREILKFKGKKEALYLRGARSIKKLLHLSPLARFRKSKLEE